MASIKIPPAPEKIKRDRQRRIVEVGGSIKKGVSLTELQAAIDARLANLVLLDGYTTYDASGFNEFQRGLSFAMLVTLVVIPAVCKLARPIPINPNMVSANDE